MLGLPAMMLATEVPWPPESEIGTTDSGVSEDKALFIVSALYSVPKVKSFGGLPLCSV